MALHAASIEEAAAGDLAEKDADQISRLSGKFLRESKKQGRMPSEDELSALGAAVVELLTKVKS